MADDPDAQKPPPPAVPDLKKALENKPAGFAWTPGATVARSAASVSAGGRDSDLTFTERMKTPVVMASVLGIALLIGGGVFCFTAVSVGESSGSAAPGGAPTAFKYHSVRSEDGMKLFPRRADDAKQDRMRLLANSAMQKPGKAVGKGGDGASDGVDDVRPPMNYDQGGMGGGGAAASGGAPSGARDAAAANVGGDAKAASPKLVSKVNVRGLHMVSSTGGFRGLKSGRAVLKEAISSRGARTSSSAGMNAAGVAGSNSAASSASNGGAGSQGLASQSGQEGGAGTVSTSGSGGGGGGGAGGAGDPAAKAPDDPRAQIQRLLAGAAADADTASTEKKRAEFLAAGGQLPQAKYHYDRYEKAKKASDEKTAEAKRLITTLEAQTAAMTK